MRGHGPHTAVTIRLTLPLVRRIEWVMRRLKTSRNQAVIAAVELWLAEVEAMPVEKESE